MNKRIALLALATALMATPALAAPETFVIDSSHTFPSFSYNHLGYTIQTSRFNKTSGKVVFDAATKTGAVDVVIDMKSVNTGSAIFNKHIQGADFLDTAKYPTATFKSTSVKFEGDKPVAVQGMLTIKGISKPITLEVMTFQRKPHPMLKKDAIGASATAIVKRSDFNAGKDVPAVGDDVTINIAIEAIKP
jgi:polyisoprenoid-binding protein YceI